MINSNFHTHTTFCDGSDDVESLVVFAIEKGFESLGFSAHSYIEEDDSWTLKKDNLKDYVEKVLSQKEKYKHKINVFCGIEQDTLSKQPEYKFDYVIGAMHSIQKGGKIYPVDLDAKSFKRLLEEEYSNDFDSLCKDYYEQIEQLAVKTRADIVAHFDLITKYVEVLSLKLPTNYLNYAEKAIIALLKKVKIFEINTGGMAKGYLSQPYPSKDILKIILKNKGEIMINSDCHNKLQLDYGYDLAENLAKEVGFTRRAIVTNTGIKLIDL